MATLSYDETIAVRKNRANDHVLRKVAGWRIKSHAIFLETLASMGGTMAPSRRPRNYRGVFLKPRALAHEVRARAAQEST